MTDLMVVSQGLLPVWQGHVAKVHLCGSPTLGGCLGWASDIREMIVFFIGVIANNQIR